MPELFPRGSTGTKNRNQPFTYKKLPHPQPNISWEEVKVLKELREDKSRVNLTTYKGVVMVIIDKYNFCNKVQDILADKDTYILITGHFITKHKKKLIQILRTMKA